MGRQTFAGRDVAADGAALDVVVAAGGAVPTGLMLPFAGTVASIPTGYLPCDGTAVSRATFADLFTAIGTVWGVGDGATTFNLPDMRARGPLGLNDGTLPAGTDGARTSRALAARSGAETHTLTIAQLAPHTHTSKYDSNTGNNIDIAKKAGGFSTDNSAGSSTGSGTAHNNMQPFAVCTYVVKT